MVIVADMHLGEGIRLRARADGSCPYDSAATLARLTGPRRAPSPARLVALGDSFHDRNAVRQDGARLLSALATLAAGLEMVSGSRATTIRWFPQGIAGERAEAIVVGPLTFRHEPRSGVQQGEIAGHLHPAAKVVSPRGGVRRPAFVSDGARLVMPAFGAYAGGLNCRDAAIERLFRRTPWWRMSAAARGSIQSDRGGWRGTEVQRKAPPAAASSAITTMPVSSSRRRRYQTGAPMSGMRMSAMPSMRKRAGMTASPISVGASKVSQAAIDGPTESAKARACSPESDILSAKPQRTPPRKDRITAA